MSLVLQLYLVIMTKYSKFGVDTFNKQWVIGYIKVFARWRRRSNNHNSCFLRNRRVNNQSCRTTYVILNLRFSKFLYQCLKASFTSYSLILPSPSISIILNVALAAHSSFIVSMSTKSYCCYITNVKLSLSVKYQQNITNIMSLISVRYI